MYKMLFEIEYFEITINIGFDVAINIKLYEDIRTFYIKKVGRSGWLLIAL